MGNVSDLVMTSFLEINNLYNATGQKVSKIVTQTGVTTTTDYLSGFQYMKKTASEPVVLQFFPQAEGYVNATQNELIGGGTSYTFNYVYNYTDHLGNIRISYSQDPSTNVLKVIEENHYYPFGLKHTGYNSDQLMYVKEASVLKIKPKPPLFKTSYDVKYQGQKRQEELGLNWDSFKWRNYDPAIGRWMNIDPLAEQMRRWSPYCYAFNNPLRFVDPDGMKPVDWYTNLTTAKMEWFDGSKEKKGYVNIGKETSGATADGKHNYSLKKDGSFNYNGKSYAKGESVDFKGSPFGIESHLNLKEKALKFTSDIVAPIVETPQDIIFPIINQISVIANEGLHEGKAYNSDNVPLPNTYELNSWSLESGRSNQSTGSPTPEEGKELINNTTSVIMLPVKAADNPATNFIIKTIVKKAIKEGTNTME